jgi:outer membrane protein insertion porin family
VVLRVAYDEGPAVPLGAVSIEGAAVVSAAEARRILGLESGEPFAPARFEAGLEELLDLYEQRGHPFARVTPRDFAHPGEVVFRLAVEEGGGAPVLGLAISGNESTKESFVAREMLLRPGDRWNARALARGRARLLRSGLFRSVGDPFPLVDEAGGGLRVGLVVEEAPANRIEGVFGWNKGAPGAEGFFSGYLDLLLKNLGGVGRRVAVRWERRGADARELRLGFREPWLPLLPLGLELDVGRVFRDSTYVRTRIHAALDAPIGPKLTLTASAGSDSWSPGDRTPEITPRSRRVRGGLAARYDGTDYPPNPSRGSTLALGGDYASKRVEIAIASADSAAPAATRTEHLREWIVRAQTAVYVALGGPHLLALAAQGEMIASDERPVPDYELLYLGGARSLRGYDEDRFLGERVAVATIEYRLRLAGRSRLFLFVDQGYVFLERAGAGGEIVGSEETPLGWGAGIQSESRLGVVGVGVGIPEGEGPSDARVHVSIEQEF